MTSAINVIPELESKLQSYEQLSKEGNLLSEVVTEEIFHIMC